MSHPPNCRCSACHLSAKLFPRTSGDRIILPAPASSGRHDSPKSPMMGTDRARFAPPRPQSTAPDQYRPHRAEPPPPMPPMPPPYRPSSRRSTDAPPPLPPAAPRPKHRHTPSQPVAGPPAPAPAPTRGPSTYTFAPPERPASAMATSSPRSSAPAPNELEWMPTRLKWVQKKERISHFTPASQYQGTSFRQYVHEGVSSSSSSRPS